LRKIKTATLEELKDVPGVGPKMAETIFGWFR
jgi:DNA uptake protein ComE-like DNA-binding protein